MEKRYHYRGDLGKTAVPEVLHTIYHYRVPGVIEAISEDVVKRIYVRDGHVVHASSSDIHDSLGWYLLNSGRLSQEDFKVTMRARRNSETRYGVHVVERGLLTPGQLYEAIRFQKMEIVWSLFSWKEGQVTFSIGDFEDPVRIPIQLPMRQVIKEGVKRVQSAKDLVARLGTKETVLESYYTTEDLIEVALDGDEWSLLKLVDGRRNLFELCNMGPRTTAENGRLLYAFYVLQLVRRASKDPSSGSFKIKLRTHGDAYSSS